MEDNKDKSKKIVLRLNKEQVAELEQAAQGDGFSPDGLAERVIEELTAAAERLERVAEQAQKRLEKIKALEEELKKPDNSQTIEKILKEGLGPDRTPIPGSDLANIMLEGREGDGTTIPGSGREIILKAAEAARKASLPHIATKGKRANNIEFPLDQLNFKAWTQPESTEGEFCIAIKRESETVDIIYNISFEDLRKAGLEIPQRITIFDKRVQLAANALYQKFGAIMTASQVYAAMGYNGRPGKSDIKRIMESFNKMRLIPIRIDNINETEKFPATIKFKYDGALLPSESITAMVDGNETDAVIHVFLEPPLISFAKSRKQITTISRELLASPMIKTEKHMTIEDYLIQRVSSMKHTNKLSNKILFSTFFEQVKATDKQQKRRAKETAIGYMNHFQTCGYISGYTVQKAGFLVHL